MSCLTHFKITNVSFYNDDIDKRVHIQDFKNKSQWNQVELDIELHINNIVLNVNVMNGYDLYHALCEFHEGKPSQFTSSCCDAYSISMKPNEYIKLALQHDRGNGDIMRCDISFSLEDIHSMDIVINEINRWIDFDDNNNDNNQ